jgi:hypothetical protein
VRQPGKSENLLHAMTLPLPLLLCAAAGFAGWWGMAWWRGADGAAPRSDGSDLSDRSDRVSRTRPAPALSPPGESARLSQLTAELAALPPERLEARRAEIANWPCSTARELALLLLAVRLAPPEEPLPDPFAPPPEETESGANEWERLAESMKRGSLEGADPFASPYNPIVEWAALDPAAASTAILKMPAGALRGRAVDEAASVMARSDPQAAWDFVLQAGEKFPGSGSARAWVKYIGAHEGDRTELARGLSLTQQESLAAALTGLTGALSDIPSSDTVAADEDLADIVQGCLALADSPAKRKLAEALVERDHFTLLYGSGAMNFYDPRSFPEHAALAASGWLATLDPQHSRGLPYLMELGNGSEWDGHSPAALSAAAPRLLPEMTRAGHVREAVELYQRIPDANVQRAALEGLLPAWMDADPQAARAAFDAAPFTALEREKWQRHPAFLLHPATDE